MSRFAGHSIHREGACKTEQVEHTPALRKFFHHLPRDPVVQEQPRIQVIAQVDNKAKSLLMNDGFIADFLERNAARLRSETANLLLRMDPGDSR